MIPWLKKEDTSMPIHTPKFITAMSPVTVMQRFTSVIKTFQKFSIEIIKCKC